VHPVLLCGVEAVDQILIFGPGLGRNLDRERHGECVAVIRNPLLVALVLPDRPHVAGLLFRPACPGLFATSKHESHSN